MGIYYVGNTGARARGSREAYILAHECGCHRDVLARECPLCSNTEGVKEVLRFVRGTSSTRKSARRDIIMRGLQKILGGSR